MLFSARLNRLNAILSLLQPLDRCSTPSAIRSAISPSHAGRSSQQPCSEPLRVINRAMVVL